MIANFHPCLAVVMFCKVALFQSLALAEDFDTSSPRYLTDEISDHSFVREISGWRLNPSFSTGVGWTDNIEDDSIAHSDSLVTSTGRLELRGRLGDIDTRLSGAVYVLKPFKTPSENDYRGDVAIELRRDFGERIRTQLKLEYKDFRPGFSTEILDRETRLALKPSLTLEHGAYTLTFSGTIGTKDFPDGDPAGKFSADARAHKFGSLEVSGSRKIAEKMTIYVGGVLRGTIYDRVRDNYGRQKGGAGGGVFAGLRGDLAETVSADLGIGYMTQNFRDRGYRDLDYVSVNGSLQWRPTERLRLTLRGETDFSEEDDYGSAGALSRELTVRAEYQSSEKVVLLAQVVREHQDFLHAGVKERTTTFSAGLDYALAKHWTLSPRYVFRHRSSDDPRERFIRNGFYTVLRFN